MMMVRDLIEHKENFVRRYWLSAATPQKTIMLVITCF